MIHLPWKKIAVNTLAVAVAVYLVLAMTAFNTPEEQGHICSTVDIKVAEGSADGFLNADEVKRVLKTQGIYPLARPMTEVDIRRIEETLRRSPFVAEAQCYKANAGTVCITVEQRMPVMRVKADNGDDYYVDNDGGIMQNTRYASDVIVATGRISRGFARTVLKDVGRTLVANPFWQNQMVQVNVLPDGTLEMVPRVGQNIVYFGPPTDLERKLDRLEKFYRYGLSRTGWQRYDYINLEFDNQIICRRRNR